MVDHRTTAATSNHTTNAAIDLLVQLSIAHTIYDHAPLYTVDDVARFAGHIPGMNNKNLLLKTKKGKQFAIVCVPFDKRVDLQALANTLDLRHLSMASPESMLGILGVSAGALSPLAAVHDTDQKVTVVIDKALTDLPQGAQIQCHPMQNTQTVVLGIADMLKYLIATNHEPRIIDVPSK
ncbi:YbaK/aminoacyl-tRNA synthetase-associated domain-containing protein [Plasmodiophora brassicae]